MSVDSSGQRQGAARPATAVSPPAPLVFALLTMVAGVAIFWPSVLALHGEWSDFANLTYTHGYLIAAICLWLFVRAGRESGLMPRVDLRAAAALALLSFAWLVAYRAGIELVHQALLPLLLIAFLCTVCGAPALRSYGFALGYLYFAIPVWNLGNGLLQSLSVSAVRQMLRFTGVPAFVDGDIVHIPQGEFRIADGCSGLHFFIVALAISALFGEVNRDSPRVRLRLVALATALALVCNWLRIYIIVLAGHLTNMQHYLVRVDHYYFGWLMFVGVMGIFFWIASRMPARAIAVAVHESASPPAGRAVLIAFAIGAGCAALGPAFGALLPVTRAEVASSALLPPIPGWGGPGAGADSWQPLFPGSDRHEQGEYHRDQAVTLYIAEYDEQRQGKELVGYGNDLFNGLPEAGAITQTINLPRGDARALQTAGGKDGGSVVAFYYEIGSRRTTRALGAQIAYGLESLLFPARSRIVAARASCAADCAAARQAVTDLLRELDGARSGS